MKQIFLCILVFFQFILGLVPKGDVEELGKIPTLIEHYRLHKSLESSLTFWAFLDEHYGNKSEKSDQHSHDHMPFYQHVLPNLIFALDPLFAISFSAFVSKEKIDWKVSSSSYFYTFSTFLLQPPQAV